MMLLTLVKLHSTVLGVLEVARYELSINDPSPCLSLEAAVARAKMGENIKLHELAFYSMASLKVMKHIETHCTFHVEGYQTH